MNLDFSTYNLSSQRISQAAKDSNGKQWYKDQCDLLDSKSFSNVYTRNNMLTENEEYGYVSEFERKKVNYDLFNNIISHKELKYVCEPYGKRVGEFPAKMRNYDIISTKIKVLLGMEMKMPFPWKIIAVNEEATTRREQEESRLIREFTVNSILAPIRQQIELEHQAQLKGRELTPQESQQIQQQVEEELKARTPDEVRRYMTREHQDPAEALAHQLLEYLIRKQKIKDVFNKGWKHGLISGEEVYWVGILNNEPCIKTVNPLYFDYDKSPDLDYIEDGEWAVAEYRMTPSEVVANFGSEMTTEEIDKVYELVHNPNSMTSDADFRFELDRYDDNFTIRVLHATWKSLKKIGFLTYKDEEGNVAPPMIVDENYKLNKANGDISIDWEWIPESQETWKISSDIYVHMRPVPGQYKDLDNLYECKLPYYGAAYDNLNSEVTSILDRAKHYIYYHNIIMYRIERLMANDKGKKFAYNISAIPRSAGIDVDKLMYYMDAIGVIFVNNAEEGNRGVGDTTNIVKDIDLSLASDIGRYIELAEYIKKRCGEAVGVPEQMEGSIGPNEAVTNTQQTLMQSSHVIQPYFDLHNNVKGNALTALLNTAKVAYSVSKPKKLAYILDDMSYQGLTLNIENMAMLDISTYGLFIGNTSQAYDAKQAVQQLAQAALQNQRADLSDVIKILRSESVQEAEEMLVVSEQRKTEEAQQIEKEKMKQAQQLQAAQEAEAEREHERQKELIILKEEERRKTEIQKQAMFSMGFDENKDRDEDGVPDVLEVAKHGLNADIQNRKLSLEENKFVHQKEVDKEKISIEKRKLQQKLKK